MSALPFTALAAGITLFAAVPLLSLERDARGRSLWLAPLAVLLPLALIVARGGQLGPAWAALAVGLVTAMLSRARDDALQSECAIKLLWTMGVSLALAWAGREQLVVATGTSVAREQWGVLQLGLGSALPWSAALLLSLLAGLVLMAGAPFHFWAADVFQGARPWLAPLAVAALQICGAGWLIERLSGIEAFPAGARLAASLLEIAGGTAFVVGAATLAWQRRPERRIGTLASFHGALLLAALVAQHGSRVKLISDSTFLRDWTAHLALALAGASTVARFLPVSTEGASPAAVLFRRHAASGVLGLFAIASLAGVPGTPGAHVWLTVARALAQANRTGLLLALGIAWLVGFAIAVRQVREAFGVPSATPAPEQPVPWQARASMWLTAAGLGALGAAWWLKV